MDVLTTGALGPWREIMVPEEYEERAIQLLSREKSTLEATAAEAAATAEEERETEVTAPPPGAI